MRKLDELLQDIPLGLLLPDSDVKEEKEEAPRRCIARSSEEAPAALRSGLPVGAAAALIAAAAAIVLAVSVKMNHSVGTEPAGQPETSGPATSAAESVNGAADVISSSEAESTSEQMQKNISAKELHILMKWYMAENPDSGLGSEDVLFVRMNDIGGENGELGMKLRQLDGFTRTYNGEACFLFEDGELKYTEFMSDVRSSGMIEIYPEYNGKSTVNYFGKLPEENGDADLSYENRVVMQTENGKMFADISDLPWLTKWYETFLACDPEPVKGLDGDPLTVHSILRIDDGGVSIFFNYAGEIVTVTTSKADNANMTVNGKHYKWDASVFDRVKDYMAQ